MLFNSVAAYIEKKAEAKNHDEGELRSQSSIGSGFRSFLEQLEND